MKSSNEADALLELSLLKLQRDMTLDSKLRNFVFDHMKFFTMKSIRNRNRIIWLLSTFQKVQCTQMNFIWLVSKVVQNFLQRSQHVCVKVSQVFAECHAQNKTWIILKTFVKHAFVFSWPQKLFILQNWGCSVFAKLLFHDRNSGLLG